jgi:hypothetical protein
MILHSGLVIFGSSLSTLYVVQHAPTWLLNLGATKLETETRDCGIP